MTTYPRQEHTVCDLLSKSANRTGTQVQVCEVKEPFPKREGGDQQFQIRTVFDKF